MNPEEVRYPIYRWVVLALAWLVTACVWWGWMIIPSLAFRLFPELELTGTQFTLVFVAPFLLAIVGGIPGGALGDRYGIRLVVAIGVFLGGVVGLARMFASDFAAMFALMCLYGVPIGFIVPNLAKLVSIWFPPRQAGLASGLYMTAMAIGSSVGLLIGPILGDLDLVFAYTGISILAAAVLWTWLARNSPKGIEIRMPYIISGVKRGARSRNIWLLAIAVLLAWGAFYSFLGHFANALEDARNISPGAAGATASLITWGVVMGQLLIPPLSDRIGLRKPFIYVGSICSAACFFFAWQLAPGISSQILTLLGGISFGSLPPLLFTIPIELPEIGHEYVGGATGCMVSLQNAGGFFIPVLVMSSLVSAGTISAYNTGFLVATIILAGVAVPTIFIKETGVRVKKT